MCLIIIEYTLHTYSLIQYILINVCGHVHTCMVSIYLHILCSSFRWLCPASVSEEDNVYQSLKNTRHSMNTSPSVSLHVCAYMYVDYKDMNDEGRDDSLFNLLLKQTHTRTHIHTDTHTHHTYHRLAEVAAAFLTTIGSLTYGRLTIR